MRTRRQVKEDIAKHHSENTPNALFKIGQKVIYINDYGVCWGEKEVIGIDNSWYGLDSSPRYYIEPTEAYWFPVNERNLRAAKQAA